MLRFQKYSAISLKPSWKDMSVKDIEVLHETFVYIKQAFQHPKYYRLKRLVMAGSQVFGFVVQGDE